MILNIFKRDKNFASGNKKSEKELVKKLIKEWKEEKEKKFQLQGGHPATEIILRKRKEKQE